MYKIQSLALACLFVLSPVLQAEMKALDDDVLSGVSGRSGLTLDLASKVEIAEVAYFDDGQGLALQGVRLSSAADPAELALYRLELDILASGDVSLTFNSENVSRFEVEEIRFVDTPGVTPVITDPSIGGIFIDYDIEGSLISYNRGNSYIGPNNVLGGLYDLDFTIQNGRLGYRTNGNEFFLDGLSLDLNSLGMVLGVTPTGELNLANPNLLAELSVEAIRYSNNPLNHGVSFDVTSGNQLPSYGSLWAKMDLATDLRIRAGGADGTTGMTINSNTVINRLDIAWGDDSDWATTGYWLGALGISGALDITNLTFDVLADPDALTEPGKDFGVGLALAFETLQLNVSVDDFILGETKSNIDSYVSSGSPLLSSIGGFDINLKFADGIYDGQSIQNRVFLQAGGDLNAGYQGLRLDTELSLVSTNNDSNFVYTEDGYSLMFSDLEAFVDGDITLDITAASASDPNGVTYYDGLRLGFEDLAFGYRTSGFRVAQDTGDIDDLKGQDLQASQSISGFSGISGLGGKPSMEGVLNGQITLGPGGNVGAEGIAVNADISVSEGKMAKFLQVDGAGLWLSGLNYDVHLRDMKLDVTSEGLSIYEGESWSKLDVTDFRIGGKDTGASFGRLVLESYEVASESIISAGGAGQICIGGVGANLSDCQADNGRWDDRGVQGITIAAKRHFKEKIEAEGKRNRFTWEVARTGEGTAGVANDTGLQLIFDNFTTNDGDGLSDTFGIQTVHNIDVARAPVIKKTTGTDSNGVFGNKGDEKIMRADGTYEYKSPSSLTAADIANRPVGVAFRNETQFKELNIDKVNLSHPVGGESTLLYGMKLQNFNITTDITATPMD